MLAFHAEDSCAPRPNLSASRGPASTGQISPGPRTQQPCRRPTRNSASSHHGMLRTWRLSPHRLSPPTTRPERAKPSERPSTRGRCSGWAPAPALAARLPSDSQPRAILTADSLQKVRGVTIPLQLDVREGALDVAQLLACQPDPGCCDVLLQAMHFRRAWDWHDPGLLRQQPGKSDLCRRRALAPGNLPERLHQGLVGLATFRREARQKVAKVVGVEPGVLVDRTRQESSP